jgi:hypothetical protein
MQPLQNNAFASKCVPTAMNPDATMEELRFKIKVNEV